MTVGKGAALYGTAGLMELGGPRRVGYRLS